MMQAEFEHVIHQKSVEGGLHDKTVYTPLTQYNLYSFITTNLTHMYALP